MPPQIKQAKLREEWATHYAQNIERLGVNSRMRLSADYWLPKISQGKLETLEAIIRMIVAVEIKNDSSDYELAQLRYREKILTKLQAEKELLENSK